MKKKNLCKPILIAFCLISTQLHSQGNYAYKAELDTIKQTAFYKIDLPPGVVAKCKAGLEDIRIFDEEGKQASYLIKNDFPSFVNENFTQFPILSIRKEADKQTHIIIQDIITKPVSDLLLFIKNTDAQRTFSISGSNDRQHWFVIKENIALDNSFKNDGENVLQTLSFPLSTYKYFQLTILGENVLPFNIVKAGVYNNSVVYGKYVRIRTPVLSQKDSTDKNSYIHIQFDDKYLVNKLTITAAGAKYFKRPITIYEGANDEFLTNNYLSSDAENAFIINAKNDQFTIVINNEDNIPLKINTVDAFQLNTCLLTYLQTGKHYYLSFGDSLATTPKYDLQFFADSISKTPLELQVNDIERITTPAPVAPAGKNNQLILWVIITAVLLILSLFTFKMAKEVNKRKADNL